MLSLYSIKSSSIALVLTVIGHSSYVTRRIRRLTALGNIVTQSVIKSSFPAISSDSGRKAQIYEPIACPIPRTCRYDVSLIVGKLGMLARVAISDENMLGL